MSRKFLVPLALPADPTQVLEATPKQYVDLRAVPAGGAAGQHLAKASATDYALTWSDPPTSGAGDQFTYAWKTTTTAVDPTSGGVKCNNADPTVATAVYISMYASDGVAGIWLLDLQVGNRFTLYKPGDVNTFIRYTVSGTPINNGPNTWFNIPVTLHEEGTTGFTANNNQAVQVGPARTTAAVVSNTDLADMATNTIKGRVAAGTGDPQDLTPAQARTVIASDAGGTTNFFRADGTFAEPAGGGGGTPVGTKLTALTALTGASAATTDIVEVVDISDTTMAASGTNKKMTLAELVIALAALGLVADADIAGLIASTRTITTTAPVRIDGGASADLSANRTLSIANDGVTNTHLATMPTLTIKGNSTGSTAGPTDLTVAQVKTMLSINEITVAGTAPSSPSVGDLWVDTT